MRRLFLGPTGSGKSEQAEQILLDTGQLLNYYATLPRYPETASRIFQHAQRRDDRWTVYEATGRPDADLSMLRVLLYGDRPVLIDGLFLLVAGITRFRGIPDDGYSPRTSVELVTRTFAEARASWVVVDPSVMVANVPYAAELNFVIHEIHRILINLAGTTTTFVNYSNEL
jgi:adenosyl cobinamide kinase/adenosyl cobinamide phosphate guanylyltransferase